MTLQPDPSRLEADKEHYATLKPGACRACDCTKPVSRKERGMSGHAMCTCSHLIAVHVPVPVERKTKTHTNGKDRPF